ncbi:structural maintenance of chromosomes flexible hinge domain-containing protein 1-like [Hydractinia symbiolongicarpus]|uniref:structural maintenance of chromosomes flexible hinge domain-containing protein 1-like n=1 Tax=Hydractinia symbiolongicarpus TaxID=13093 RepID=UPI00254B650D|nr:structural maintenance of chromosomes flexible hinge domain-containing protein 1-like [Hydractinia symbiolongicarpus]
MASEVVHKMTSNGSGNHFKQNFVYVFDRRTGDKPGLKLEFSDFTTYEALLTNLKLKFKIGEDESFAVVNTERVPINSDETLDKVVENGNTLYILTSLDQELSAPVREHVQFLPHYDTLTKSGMYEYYASEGQDPLPFAFAELIDNALYATANNSGPRRIEIRLMFDDTTNRNSVCILDNGRGMTSKDLNEWAIYRLSKFNRRWRNKQFIEKNKDDVEEMPRSLNSDISYFGVGGKQAIFFIGNATRMISKSRQSKDVHEMILSKDDFESKERNKEAIYTGSIYNRRVGDACHVNTDDENLRKLILEEGEHDSFTNVFITGVKPSHVAYMKSHFEIWCTELAHIYHYYLHGPYGNVKQPGNGNTSNFQKIDLQVSLFERGKPPKHISLKDVDDDVQTLYIRSAASTFDFKAHVNGAQVEGQLRYHPFLYDKETYPTAADVGAPDSIGDEDMIIEDSRAPRGNIPIFECFWNGRLIPYTNIKSLEWCENPRKRTALPIECYNRFSGVLWTNDSFQVSTNKLTFIDLETKLREKDTLYNRVILGQEQRLQISKAFFDWIKNSHETFDKQIRFFGLKGQTKRSDLSARKNQDLWTLFSGIEWHGKTFQEGKLVRTFKTNPVIIGTIKQFLLHGEYESDEVYGTGGEVEIIQEPTSLYGQKRIFPLAKLDLLFNQNEAADFISKEELKLPSKLVIDWPEGNELKTNSDVPAGSTIGAMKVDIKNGKGESIHKIPGDRGKRLLVELKVVWHSEKSGNKVIIQHTCQHGGKSWPYWFRKMENTVNLGKHTLSLNVVLADSSILSSSKSLPKEIIKFNVIEGSPFKFVIAQIEAPLRIGVPFQILLKLVDYYGNTTKPGKDRETPTLASNGDITYSHSGFSIRGSLLAIKDVVAHGSLGSSSGKDFNMKIVIPDLDENTQTTKLRFLPGLPAKLDVKPLNEVIKIENGGTINMAVEIKDIAGNITFQPRLNVVCKLTGSPGLPSFMVDCSSTGKGSLISPKIDIEKIRENVVIEAKIDLQHCKSVDPVVRTVHVSPSTRPARFQLFYLPHDSGTPLRIQNDEELCCKAGNLITGITYRMLDEGNRLINIDTSISSKIKVNWAAKLSKDQLKLGNLPDIKTPTSTDETKYCQILYNGVKSVNLSFIVRTIPNNAQILSCSCSENKILPNEKAERIVELNITDKHGNSLDISNVDLSKFEVSGDGLGVSSLPKVLSKDGKLLMNVQFDDITPGFREINVKYGALETYQRLEIKSGPATNIKLVNFDNTEPITLFNGRAWSNPITMQLIDAQGYSCNESNIRVVLGKDGNIKLTPANLTTKRTDNKGQVTFKDFTVSTPACQGMFELVPKAIIGKNTVTGPTITFEVQPDPFKPISVEMEFNGTAVQAGGALPVIESYVVAEDKSPMSNVKAREMVLKLVPHNTSQLRKEFTYLPSKTIELDKVNHFYFRNVTAPEKIGRYSLTVQYVGKGGATAVLQANPIIVDILASDPLYLVPLNNLPTPTVSNVNKLSSRTLLKNVTLHLLDAYKNKSGENWSGEVIVAVRREGKTPLLNNNQTTVKFPVVKGECMIDLLTVPANAEGRNGQEYVLKFNFELDSKQRHNVAPYNLPFVFFNDAQKHLQMSQLVKERDSLVQNITTYKTFFSTTRQLTQEMKVAVDEAAKQEMKLRSEVFAALQSKITNKLDTVEKIDRFFIELNNCKNEINRKPRRECKLQPARRDPLVLGKVAHLAEVKDDDVARVLSWHMAGDMDCIVTMTTEKAQQIYKESRGNLQVLPLDSIYKKNITDVSRPLPHQRIRNNTWTPTGNPIYARNLLSFKADAQCCNTVFGMLLGDLIIMDDLESANNYRLHVVKAVYCPTILTRSGDRLRSNGKFGGLSNKAPVLERLHGAVFAAPLNTEVNRIEKCLDLLQGLKAAVENHAKASEELAYQIRDGESQEMQSKRVECDESEKQLKEIERRLGMTPSRFESDGILTTKSGVSSKLESPDTRRASKRPTGVSTPTISPSKKIKQSPKSTPRTRRSK